MCLPAAVVGILGGVVSGIGGAMQAQQQAAAYEAQAEVQRRQAALELEAGSDQARQKQRDVARTVGAQRAAFAGSGLALSGTALNSIEESAEEGAMDVAAIRWNSDLSAQNRRVDASVLDMNAKSARRSAPISFLSPVIGSVAQFGSSFGS